MSAEEALWPALIAWKREVTGENAVPLTPEDIAAIRAATIDRWRAKPPSGPLTLNVALELIDHEAIVREAYKDSVGVWTWSVGITNASGHTVYPRYKDNPQTIEHCLAVYLWALQAKYVPDVLKAFKGFALTEAQFAAALSFHYNTGAILQADWVTHWKGGSAAQARLSFMNWRKPASIIPRREKERDLFFDGKWSNDGCATIFPVKKPSYQPDFAHPERVDVRPILTGLLP